MSDGSPSRALVLGGGGPVGVAWEVGIAAGLASAGVDLTAADLTVGTSAGSLAGAMLMTGDDPTDLAADVVARFHTSVADSGVDRVELSGLMGLMELVMGGRSDGVPEADWLAEVGRVAIDADTIPEETFVATFASTLDDRSWPEGFRCTAVDAENGHFKVWDAAAGVSLSRAVASSCSVPGIYPPVTIDGRRYMDGGVRSPLNADLAQGHSSVIAVSVMITELPAGIDDPRLRHFFSRQHQAVAELRGSGAAVELIEPDPEFLGISGMGLNLMDFGRISEAAEAGARLGKLEADRVGAIW